MKHKQNNIGFEMYSRRYLGSVSRQGQKFFLFCQKTTGALEAQPIFFSKDIRVLITRLKQEDCHSPLSSTKV
jgi:hypothetical protein